MLANHGRCVDAFFSRKITGVCICVRYLKTSQVTDPGLQELREDLQSLLGDMAVERERMEKEKAREQKQAALMALPRRTSGRVARLQEAAAVRAREELEREEQLRMAELERRRIQAERRKAREVQEAKEAEERERLEKIRRVEEQAERREQARLERERRRQERLEAQARRREGTHVLTCVGWSAPQQCRVLAVLLQLLCLTSVLSYVRTYVVGDWPIREQSGDWSRRKNRNDLTRKRLNEPAAGVNAELGWSTKFLLPHARRSMRMGNAVFSAE